jgi:uncharacterized protein (DUF305 family)
MYRPKTAAMALALITAATLAACGSTTPTAVHQAVDHNDVDVTFAHQMIPHHAQAVRMAELAPTRAASDQVKRLAAAIQSAQQPEIDQLTAMLTSWGAAPPADPGMSGMDQGSMPGMMTDAQMTGLGQTTGAEFDRRFLTMMIGHHEGALDMSATELAQGRNPTAQALARKITDAQRAEIDQMRRLLAD